MDVSDWVFEDGKLLAWSAWLPILANRGLSEFDLPPVRVAVNINVGDAHCCGWDVYIKLCCCFVLVLLVCRSMFGLKTRRWGVRMFGSLLKSVVVGLRTSLYRCLKGFVSVSKIRDK